MKTKKYFIWRSTYAKSLNDSLNHNLSDREIEAFYTLWVTYRISQLVKSCFFKLFRCGDDNYNLTVQKYIDDNYVVKFTYHA